MIELVELLKKEQLTIASCESLTAGLFSATMASIPSTSSILCGGVVTYMTRVKSDVVGVEQSIIDKYGVVSSECAKSMASHIKTLLQSDIGVSATGNAGPTSLEGKPVGCVYIAVSYHENVVAKELQLDGNRNEIREKTVECMCKLITDVIKSEGEFNGKK